MAAPKTIRDMLIDGDITRGGIEKIAASLFNGRRLEECAPEGYKLFAPIWKDLDQRNRDYIVKVLVESEVVNILEQDDDEEFCDSDFEEKPMRWGLDAGETD